MKRGRTAEQRLACASRAGECSRQIELLSRQLELERRLASQVEDANGLTADERNLLRSTRPIRDPIDVLEAKIRGGSVVDASESQTNVAADDRSTS